MRILLTVLALLIPAGIRGGGSLDFDGSTDDIAGPDIAAIDSATTMSGAAWVFHDTLTDDDTIISQYLTDGFIFLRDDVGTSARTDIYKIFLADSADASSANIEGATNSSVATTWTHIAFTAEAGQSNGLRLYVNGVEDANSPVSLTDLAAWDSGGAVYMIGERESGTSGHNGKIAFPVMWNYVLSAEEVVENMHCMNRPAKGRIVSYSFQQSGSTATDLTGNGNDGTVTGATEDADGPPTSWCGEG